MAGRSVAGDREKVVVVGAGVGGLSAALALVARGLDVTVLERAGTIGGKMREVPVAGRAVDGGPTVFTMRWVFEELFAEAGADFGAAVRLLPATTIARHAWGPDGFLDLFVDKARSAEAIAAFAGRDEARRYLAFCDHSAEVFSTLEHTFLRASRPSDPIEMSRRVGFLNIGKLMRLQPFASLWSSLGAHFTDPRLRQLFGRYATYCGSSPYEAPATLMIVAHVEQDGVWRIEGGMHRLAEALAARATALGATIRTGVEVARVETTRGRVSGVVTSAGERLAAAAVIVNADASAVGAGLLGGDVAPAAKAVPPPKRSLSALVWTAVAETSGFPLVHHSVFFSRDYQDEFRRIFDERKLPDEPTVYVCAQDRGDDDDAPRGAERLLILTNSPAVGDDPTFDVSEIERCQERTFRQLERCGLRIATTPERTVLTGPREFGALFPATGGALYGRASHGSSATFERPDARTPVPGLYLAGGSVHPGPGVPMAALSGRLAARSLLSDFASTRR